MRAVIAAFRKLCVSLLLFSLWANWTPAYALRSEAPIEGAGRRKLEQLLGPRTSTAGLEESVPASEEREVVGAYIQRILDRYLVWAGEEGADFVYLRLEGAVSVSHFFKIGVVPPYHSVIHQKLQEAGIIDQWASHWIQPAATGWMSGPQGVTRYVTLLVRAAGLEEERIQQWIRDLGEDPLGIRYRRAIEALVGAGATAVPALGRSLAGRRWSIRLGSATALAQIGPPAAPAVRALIRVLEEGDKDIRIRRAAVEALGSIGTAATPAVPALLKLLRKDSSLYVRGPVLRALEQIDSDAGLEEHPEQRSVTEFNHEPQAITERTLVGHTSAVWALAFSPDGKTLVSGGDDGKVLLWDVGTGERMGVLRQKMNLGRGTLGTTASVFSLAFSPDGTTLATGGLNEFRFLWDLKGNRAWGKRAKKLMVEQQSRRFKPQSSVSELAFSQDSQTLFSVTGVSEGRVDFWKVSTGEQMGGFKLSSGREKSSSNLFSGKVLKFDLHPGRGILASGDEVGVIRLWFVSSGRQIRSLQSSSLSGIMTLAFSPDGKILASALRDPSAIEVWDVDSRTRQRILTAESRVWSLAFHPQGNRLASGSDNGTVQIWDLETGKEVQRIESHLDTVFSLAFSPDGKILASGSGVQDKTVKLWSLFPFTGLEEKELDLRSLTMEEIRQLPERCL